MFSSYRLTYFIHRNPEGIPPTQHADESLDLYCPRRTIVAPTESIDINTGVKLQFSVEKCGLVLNKSTQEKRFEAEVGIFVNKNKLNFSQSPYVTRVTRNW